MAQVEDNLTQKSELNQKDQCDTTNQLRSFNEIGQNIEKTLQENNGNDIESKFIRGKVYSMLYAPLSQKPSFRVTIVTDDGLYVDIVWDSRRIVNGISGESVIEVEVIADEICNEMELHNPKWRLISNSSR